MATALAGLALLMGVLMGVAGWGLATRREWARILTLVLGGLAVFAALGSLSPLNAVSLLAHAGYAALVFAVLLTPRYAAEFTPSSATAEGVRLGAAPVGGVHGLHLGWPLVVLALGTLCLGFGLGWGLSRLAGTASGGPRPLVAVLPADNQSREVANRHAQWLTRSAKVRVLDTHLLAEGATEAPAGLRERARESGADLVMVVQQLKGGLSIRVVEAKTGVLLLARETPWVDEQGLVRFVELAADESAGRGKVDSELPGMDKRP